MAATSGDGGDGGDEHDEQEEQQNSSKSKEAKEQARALGSMTDLVRRRWRVAGLRAARSAMISRAGLTMGCDPGA
jgi:hypothetical protein